MASQQVMAAEAPHALGTLERLFLGVCALVPVQMFQAGKGASARWANMWSRLVGLLGRTFSYRIDADVDFGRCNECRVSNSQTPARRRCSKELG